MQPVNLIPHDHRQRLGLIVDESWRIFQSHFSYGRHPIVKEAPFQHHFANILSTVGQLYCLERNDVFFVDLEVKCENIKGKSKFIDISCSFVNANVACAIELKFKTAKQGAQDYGRIDAYTDIEAVELACESKFQFGRFFMITDSTAYVNKSKVGVGTVFCLHEGFQTVPGRQLSCPECGGRNDVVVNLSKPYRFSWQRNQDWYFLQLQI